MSCARVSQVAEWDRPGAALVCSPEVDSLSHVLGVSASDLLGRFPIQAARQQHDRFCAVLQSEGLDVVDIHEVPTEDDLSALRRLAAESLIYDIDPAIDVADRYSIGVLHQLTIEALDTQALVDAVTLRPEVRIRPRAYADHGLTSAVELQSLKHCYSMRSSVITTAQGTVVGRSRLDVNRPDNDLAELVLRRLRTPPVLRVAPPGTLEGGDFFPAGPVVFQGQGLLSDDDGIGQLLDHGAYGEVEVAIIRDGRSQLDEIRLDTYFTLFGPSLAALSSDRVGTDEPEVEVWTPEATRHGKRYVRSRPGGIRSYLEDMGYEVVPMSAQECGDLAANGLLVGPRRYVCAQGPGPEFIDRLRTHGVTVQEIAPGARVAGRGGPRRWAQMVRYSDRGRPPGP